MNDAHILDRFDEGWIKSIDCGDGWEQIILDLDADLTEMDPNYRIQQIKEKFGGLRYYIEHDHGDHDWKTCPLEARIRAAEIAAINTCEVCGKHGMNRRSDSGWYETRCYEHARK